MVEVCTHTVFFLVIRLDIPEKVQQYDQQGGYVYEKPAQRFVSFTILTKMEF